jgi:phage terminase large subunit GpA-like protein
MGDDVGLLDETIDEQLARIEAEEFDAIVRPAENPRDLISFARSLYLPPDKVGKPAEIYNPDSHPVQMAVLRLLAASEFRRYTIVACTQDGKSWLIQILIFWLATELKETVIVGGPDMRIAQDTWRQKTRPAMIASGLGDYLPSSGPGSAGGSDVDTIQLTGGGLVILLGAGGKNASGQAGRTSRAVFVDEYGKIKPLLAHKFDRRADSYGEDGRLYKSGTIEADSGDPLQESYEDSSKGTFVFRCHLCGEYTPLEWQQVSADYTTEKSAESSVRIACSRCGHEWTDADRRANLAGVRYVHDGQTVGADGSMTGPEPETYHCGIRWHALHSPRRSLGMLAVLYRDAMRRFERGNAQALIDFYHDQLATRAPIDDGSEAIENNHLVARSAASTYLVVRLTDGAGNEVHGYLVPRIPDGVTFTTAAIDQSLRRLWWTLRGHDAEGRTWTLGYGRIPICGDMETPTKEQRWAALNRLRELLGKGQPWADGTLSPCIVGVDVGEFSTETFEWLKNAPDWMAIRGTGDRQAQDMQASDGRVQISQPGWYVLRTYDKSADGTREVLWIDSDRVKTELSRSLRREPGAMGAAHLPMGLLPEDELIWQLCGERWEKTPGGRWTWVKHAKRVDLWDTHYYTQCLGKYMLDCHPDRTQREVIPSDRTSDEPEGGGADLSWR